MSIDQKLIRQLQLSGDRVAAAAFRLKQPHENHPWISDLQNLTPTQALEATLAELRYFEERLCERNIISEERIQEIFVKLYSETEVDKTT